MNLKGVDLLGCRLIVIRREIIAQTNFLNEWLCKSVTLQLLALIKGIKSCCSEVGIESSEITNDYGQSVQYC